ncbi:MAG: dihydroorotate dehydrogenase-like protein [Candidatus Delongbacteria bacterium]|nr:dihydroorotate dehydrogenase-like protein [Candidatus Delongbacteria bacterium]MBN2834092.1 dihydroorotate dehydrogenase-like protein [Candidatus Delongbacteria bacterium]
MDLSVTYMGLKLKNPVIVGSCGLTNDVEEIKKLEKNGAAAIVLKSLFEEQILNEADSYTPPSEMVGHYPEAYDYLTNFSKDFELNKYLDFIRKCKKEVSIPVIASINCVSTEEWIHFAQEIEKAGADALELNVFVLPTELRATGAENEKFYFNLADKVKKIVKLPVSLKVSYFFSSLGNSLQRLSISGINSLVLFNRFYSPDINIETEEIVSSHILSTENEISIPLKWIGYLSSTSGCDLCASTGIHNGKGVVKALLAGASAVQIVSSLYLHGNEYISKILTDIEDWMKSKNYHTVSDFKGKLARNADQNPAAYERVQFMKYFGEYKR